MSSQSNDRQGLKEFRGSVSPIGSFGPFGGSMIDIDTLDVQATEQRDTLLEEEDSVYELEGEQEHLLRDR